VVFEEDGPSTTLLAVIAAELRSPRMRVPALQILEERAAGKRRSNFPVSLTNIHTDRCQSCFPKIRKTHFEVRSLPNRWTNLLIVLSVVYCFLLLAGLSYAGWFRVG